MQLNRQQTDFFIAACFFKNEPTTGNESDMLYWMFRTNIITDTAYNAQMDLMDTWVTAYNNGELYGTDSTGSSYLITSADITKIPQRPKRNG